MSDTGQATSGVHAKNRHSQNGPVELKEDDVAPVSRECDGTGDASADGAQQHDAAVEPHTELQPGPPCKQCLAEQPSQSNLIGQHGTACGSHESREKLPLPAAEHSKGHDADNDSDDLASTKNPSTERQPADPVSQERQEADALNEPTMPKKTFKERKKRGFFLFNLFSRSSSSATASEQKQKKKQLQEEKKLKKKLKKKKGDVRLQRSQSLTLSSSQHSPSLPAPSVSTGLVDGKKDAACPKPSSVVNGVDAMADVGRGKEGQALMRSNTISGSTRKSLQVFSPTHSLTSTTATATATATTTQRAAVMERDPARRGDGVTTNANSTRQRHPLTRRGHVSEGVVDCSGADDDDEDVDVDGRRRKADDPSHDVTLSATSPTVADLHAGRSMDESVTSNVSTVFGRTSSSLTNTPTSQTTPTRSGLWLETRQMSGSYDNYDTSLRLLQGGSVSEEPLFDADDTPPTTAIRNDNDNGNDTTATARSTSSPVRGHISGERASPLRHVSTSSNSNPATTTTAVVTVPVTASDKRGHAKKTVKGARVNVRTTHAATAARKRAHDGNGNGDGDGDGDSGRLKHRQKISKSARRRLKRMEAIHKQGGAANDVFLRRHHEPQPSTQLVSQDTRANSGMMLDKHADVVTASEPDVNFSYENYNAKTLRERRWKNTHSNRYSRKRMKYRGAMDRKYGKKGKRDRRDQGTREENDPRRQQRGGQQQSPKDGHVGRGDTTKEVLDAGHSGHDDHRHHDQDAVPGNVGMTSLVDGDDAVHNVSTPRTESFRRRSSIFDSPYLVPASQLARVLANADSDDDENDEKGDHDREGERAIRSSPQRRSHEDSEAIASPLKRTLSLTDVHGMLDLYNNNNNNNNNGSSSCGKTDYFGNYAENYGRYLYASTSALAGNASMKALALDDSSVRLASGRSPSRSPRERGATTPPPALAPSPYRTPSRDGNASTTPSVFGSPSPTTSPPQRVPERRQGVVDGSLESLVSPNATLATTFFDDFMNLHFSGLFVDIAESDSDGDADADADVNVIGEGRIQRQGDADEQQQQQSLGDNVCDGDDVYFSPADYRASHRGNESANTIPDVEGEEEEEEESDYMRIGSLRSRHQSVRSVKQGGPALSGDVLHVVDGGSTESIDSDSAELTKMIADFVELTNHSKDSKDLNGASETQHGTGEQVENKDDGVTSTSATTTTTKNAALGVAKRDGDQDGRGNGDDDASLVLQDRASIADGDPKTTMVKAKEEGAEMPVAHRHKTKTPKDPSTLERLGAASVFRHSWSGFSSTANPLSPSPQKAIGVGQQHQQHQQQSQPRSHRTNTISDPMDSSVAEGANTAAARVRVRGTGREGRAVHDEAVAFPMIMREEDIAFERLLGQGFYGRVFLCTYSPAQTKVVVKELKLDDSESKAGFVAEINLLRILNHDNILHLAGLFNRQERLYMVTEFVPNGTMEQHILHTTTPLPWHIRISMAEDVTRGMAYLHAHGIMHRDLKTENLLVRHDLSIVIADFGLAIAFDGNAIKPRPAERLKAHQSVRIFPKKIKTDRQKLRVVGTTDWMAPEVVLGKPYDTFADVFSFGMVVLSLLTRMHPDPDKFRNFSFALDEKRLQRSCEEGYPPSLFSLCCRCGAADPNGRPTFGNLSSWLYVIDLQLARDAIASN